MYAYFKGKLAAKKADRIVVECGGIGYNLFFPTARIASLGPLGSEVLVHTYTSVREDALQLYGFGTEEELELFIQLIGVSGVGPKAAQSLLSELTPSQIRLAILSGDTKTLSKAQGGAKKTAERLIVDLKGKLEVNEALLLGGGSGAGPMGLPEPAAAEGAAGEAIEALTALGYSASAARAAVAKAAGEAGGEAPDTEALLKLALKYM